MNVTTLHTRVLAALMAALTAVGAYVAIPIGPVPIIMATVFVLLAGMLLGSRAGAISMGVYLTLGFIGLPVFSHGRGGVAHMVGPAGGYLLGYVLAAWVAGRICERHHQSFSADVLGALFGTLVIFAVGIPWLRFHPTLPYDWRGAFSVGFVPFVPGAVLKGILVVTVARHARPVLHRTLDPETT